MNENERKKNMLRMLPDDAGPSFEAAEMIRLMYGDRMTHTEL